jgi:hypothetical protein
MDHEKIAEIAHEVNRAYCQALGDDSQPSWANAPDWQKTSCIEGVRFHAVPTERSPSASHEAWMSQKLADGWKYGEIKDPDKKEHPCMVPFDQLPKEQQAKDYIFRAVVLSCLD